LHEGAAAQLWGLHVHTKYATAETIGPDSASLRWTDGGKLFTFAHRRYGGFNLQAEGEWVVAEVKSWMEQVSLASGLDQMGVTCCTGRQVGSLTVSPCIICLVGEVFHSQAGVRLKGWVCICSCGISLGGLVWLKHLGGVHLWWGECLHAGLEGGGGSVHLVARVLHVGGINFA
jgi:hypothetical protein